MNDCKLYWTLFQTLQSHYKALRNTHVFWHSHKEANAIVVCYCTIVWLKCVSVIHVLCLHNHMILVRVYPTDMGNSTAQRLCIYYCWGCYTLQYKRPIYLLYPNDKMYRFAHYNNLRNQNLYILYLYIFMSDPVRMM